MRWGQLGWLISLAGLPLSPFLWMPRLDFWHAQSAWMHYSLVILLVIALWQGGWTVSINKPLAAWMAWIGCWTLINWHQSIMLGKTYNLNLLMPFLHCCSILFFVIAAMSLWTKAFLPTLLRWMARVSILIMLYGFLQLFQLDQFLSNIDDKRTDLLVGTIGNPTHLAAYLALCFPLLLAQHGWRWRIATGMNLLLLGILLIRHGSIGGPICAVITLALWTWHRRSRWGLITLGGLSLFGLWLLWTHPTYLNPSGRLEAWRVFWDVFQRKPITGLGTGAIAFLAETIKEPQHPIHKWRHVHNEYLQLAIEQGVIGFSLVLWAIGDSIRRAWRLRRDALVTTLSGCGITFLLLSLISFPWHLWLLASFGLVSYVGLILCEQETCPPCPL